MKRFFFSCLLSTTLLFSGCGAIKKVAGLIAPSELEMALGLKDGLTQGLFRGFNAFADPNGNPFVRFALLFQVKLLK